MERLQRRAAIICTGALSRTETSSLLADLGWQRLCDRRSSAKLILMYKILNNLTPDYLRNDLPLINNVTLSLNLRNSWQIRAPRCRTTKFKKSFFPMTIDKWNRIIKNPKINLTSLNSFKLSLINIGIGINRSSLFNALSGPCARSLTQIRLGLSKLRGQLFSYNITDNPICPLCLDAFESDMHFFFECNALNDVRVSYLSKVKMFVPNLHVFDKREILNLCVSGDENLDFQTNILLLRCSMEYINKTERFSDRY
ncbi:MAG: hypothetical protein WAX04_08775 [Oscillospiraceae bacterium]